VNELEIKNLLKETYRPFFGSFGRLTAIQVALIPPLMEGKNAVGVSPAASGKTEAALAPVAERALRVGRNPLSILYVAPTRALINDVEKRARMPLASLGLSLSVRTGDRPQLRTADPENVLLTTPESLDSLLCRAPGIWRHTRAVILDEIHLVDGTYRGDQLRVLLRRLERFHTESPVQYCALSATISNPEEMGARYFPVATVVRAGPVREISFQLFSHMEEVIALLREKRYHKGLIFCNSRKEVEELALGLRNIWPQDRIVVHHGSLSRKERESVEQTMHRWSWGLCICTMTMELGIDIGDIDAVVLYGPPPTPSAFLQRGGRGGRRRKEMTIIGCYRGSPAEKEQLETFWHFARTGLVEETEYEPDISVCVQQVFSLLYGQPRGLSRQEMEELLFPLAEPNTLKTIVLHLMDRGFVEASLGRYRATTRLMNMGYRGLIHSNIPQTRDFRIVDADTGGAIGELSTDASLGARFVLAGRVWEVVEVKARQKQLVVRQVGPLDSDTRFGRRSSRGAFSGYLPKELRSR